MISVTGLLHHLALVSFIDILIIDNQQSHQYYYRTVLLYIDSNDPIVYDISDQITQTLLPTVPVILCDCNQMQQTFTRSYSDQNLNIILLNNRSSITKINKISNNLYVSDENIIVLVNDSDASLPYSLDFLHAVDFLHRFVLIGPDSVMVAFWLYRRTFDIQAYTVDMFNRDSVISHFQKVYDHGLVSLNGTQIRVFMSYSPPWSLVCPTDSTLRFYKYLGPDALATEFILFHLNATIVMTTDLAIEEPNYARWFTLRGRNNIEVMWLHKEVFGDTEITEFYARYV